MYISLMAGSYLIGVFAIMGGAVLLSTDLFPLALATTIVGVVLLIASLRMADRA